MAALLVVALAYGRPAAVTVAVGVKVRVIEAHEAEGRFLPRFPAVPLKRLGPVHHGIFEGSWLWCAWAWPCHKRSCR